MDNPLFLPIISFFEWFFSPLTVIPLISSFTRSSGDLEVISMLVDPNLNSPANIDAAVNMKNDYDAWKKKATTNRPSEQPEGQPWDYPWDYHGLIMINEYEWDWMMTGIIRLIMINNGTTMGYFDGPSSVSVVNRWLGHPLSAYTKAGFPARFDSPRNLMVVLQHYKKVVEWHQVAITGNIS